MTEIWNAYLQDGSLTDLVLYRDQPIPKGYYHLVVEAMIRHTDGDLLFVKRASDKPSYPNYWECSAGGSALFGENPEEAIKREIREETGLELGRLELFDSFINEEHQCYFKIFLAETAQDKNSIQLQVEETSDYQWVAPDNLADFLTQNQIIPRHEKTLRCINKKNS